jgi:hypothetical protein
VEKKLPETLAATLNQVDLRGRSVPADVSGRSPVWADGVPPALLGAAALATGHDQWLWDKLPQPEVFMDRRMK